LEEGAACRGLSEDLLPPSPAHNTLCPEALVDPGRAPANEVQRFSVINLDFEIRATPASRRYQKAAFWELGLDDNVKTV
jgi:hypothetical protein